MGADETATMRTVRFHEYGEPADVLRLDEAPVPDPGPGRIRVTVHACGLNPADRALYRGLFPGNLPRGIGLELSGTVEAVGEGVTDVAPGDLVLGTADYAGCPSAGTGGPGAGHGAAQRRAARPGQGGRGDPRRILTSSDFDAAAELGVRDTFHEDQTERHDVLGEFAQLAADGKFTIPVARTFPLEDWRTALGISQGGHARGKLVLLPAGQDGIS
jgi:NADPH:quinone reductase-like Zn-dependent oxidoreductase